MTTEKKEKKYPETPEKTAAEKEQMVNDISNLILTISKLLSDNQEEIKIESEGVNTISYKIYAPESERGKIIGKNGLTIREIRSLVQKIATPYKFKIQIHIIE